MRLLKVGTGRVRGLAFTPDGRTLIAQDGDGKLTRAVRWFDLAGGVEPASVSLVVSDLALTADRRRFAALEFEDGIESVSLWSAAARRRTARLTWQPARGGRVAFAPDARALVVSGWAELTVWELPARRPRLLALGPDNRGAMCLAFSPDGAWLACGGYGGVLLWPGGRGRRTARLYRTDHRWARALAFAPDGRSLATAFARTVFVWDVGRAAVAARLRGHTGEVNAVGYSPDGRLLASAGNDGTLRLWDPAGGPPRWELPGGAGRLSAVAFSPDGLTVAAGGEHGRVVIWDVDEG
jgi:WD40 repeat protein